MILRGRREWKIRKNEKEESPNSTYINPADKDSTDVIPTDIVSIDIVHPVSTEDIPVDTLKEKFNAADTEEREDHEKPATEEQSEEARIYNFVMNKVYANIVQEILKEYASRKDKRIIRQEVQEKNDETQNAQSDNQLV